MARDAASPIPVLDLKAQYAAIRADVDRAVAEVIDSGQFVLGPVVRDLEERVARYCGCAHGVGVASGTDALRLALQALGVGPGDEVITSAFTFIASANTVSRAGAIPVFADIDPKTFNLDPASVEAAVTPRTKALVPVHLYGQPAAMDALLGIARSRGLHVVEDAAQAIGARYRGRPVGSLGACGCFSFYPTKNLGAYGDAGMVVTDDEGLARKVDRLRQHGEQQRYNAAVVGFNSRLDALQAAVLRVKLDRLDDWNAARRRLARAYDERLAGVPVTPPWTAPEVEHVYHQYTIRAPRRDELAAFLRERGIGTMVYYPYPLHRQPIYASLGLAEGSLPESEAAAAEVLSLPIYPELGADRLDRVAASIREFYGG